MLSKWQKLQTTKWRISVKRNPFARHSSQKKIWSELQKSPKTDRQTDNMWSATNVPKKRCSRVVSKEWNPDIPRPYHFAEMFAETSCFSFMKWITSLKQMKCLIKKRKTTRSLQHSLVKMKGTFLVAKIPKNQTKIRITYEAIPRFNFFPSNAIINTLERQ